MARNDEIVSRVRDHGIHEVDFDDSEIRKEIPPVRDKLNMKLLKDEGRNVEMVSLLIAHKLELRSRTETGAPGYTPPGRVSSALERSVNSAFQISGGKIPPYLEQTPHGIEFFHEAQSIRPVLPGFGG